MLIRAATDLSMVVSVKGRRDRGWLRASGKGQAVAFLSKNPTWREGQRQRQKQRCSSNSVSRGKRVPSQLKSKAGASCCNRQKWDPTPGQLGRLLPVSWQRRHTSPPGPQPSPTSPQMPQGLQASIMSPLDCRALVELTLRYCSSFFVM